MVDHLKGFVIENPTSMRGQIYEKVKQEILSGGIPPGSRVLEGRLAEQLNVSRTPVREAMHVLEMEGFLESFPRVGYRVRQITWEEVVEIHDIRAVIEPLAARRAMENRDQAYIGTLEEVIKQSETAIEQDRSNTFFRYDALFDETIVRASGMKTLLDVWATLRQRLSLYRMEAQYSLDTRLRAIKGHRRILECLRVKDKNGAGKAIREHLADSREDIKHIAFERMKSRIMV
jgi:DNA-binding GntR family transcriptional regulator